MSGGTPGVEMTAAGGTPISRRVRAYFAPVDRTSGTPTIFDAARDGGFAVDAPPAPWIDLGWCEAFTRRAETAVRALNTGSPAMPATQTRTAVEATVAVAFASWGKLQMALCSGAEKMNLLATESGLAGNGVDCECSGVGGRWGGERVRCWRSGGRGSGFLGADRLCRKRRERGLHSRPERRWRRC